jgi:large subunit ribosomal protein L22
VNQVLDLLRGENVEDALTTLSFSKKHVSQKIEKTIRSAVANAVQEDSGIDVEDLYVKEALVGPGPIMKRWLPRAQGRATPILKRTSHITIVLAPRDSKKKQRAKAHVDKSKESRATHKESRATQKESRGTHKESRA